MSSMGHWLSQNPKISIPSAGEAFNFKEKKVTFIFSWTPQKLQQNKVKVFILLKPQTGIPCISALPSPLTHTKKPHQKQKHFSLTNYDIKLFYTYWDIMLLRLNLKTLIFYWLYLYTISILYFILKLAADTRNIMPLYIQT